MEQSLICLAPLTIQKTIETNHKILGMVQSVSTTVARDSHGK